MAKMANTRKVRKGGQSATINRLVKSGRLKKVTSAEINHLNPTVPSAPQPVMPKEPLRAHFRAAARARVGAKVEPV